MQIRKKKSKSCPLPASSNLTILIVMEMQCVEAVVALDLGDLHILLAVMVLKRPTMPLNTPSLLLLRAT